MSSAPRIFRLEPAELALGADRMPIHADADFFQVINLPAGCDAELRIGSTGADPMPLDNISSYANECFPWTTAYLSFSPLVTTERLIIGTGKGCRFLRFDAASDNVEVNQGTAGAQGWPVWLGDVANRVTHLTPADALAAALALRVGAHPLLYNGATFDRQRGNTDVTIAASAARTATLFGAAQINHNARGVVIIPTITAVGTGTLTVFVRMFDPVSGLDRNVQLGTIVPGDGVGQFGFACYPGAVLPASGWKGVASLPLARQWSVLVTHSDASSWTYDVGASLII